MIDDALLGTSVTAVLIGNQTAGRDYVKYEIAQSMSRGNGLLGVSINRIEDKDGKTDKPGNNPLSSVYKFYKWVGDNGYANFGDLGRRRSQGCG